MTGRASKYSYLPLGSAIKLLEKTDADINHAKNQLEVAQRIAIKC